MWLGMVSCGVFWCGVKWFGVMWCGGVQHGWYLFRAMAVDGMAWPIRVPASNTPLGIATSDFGVIIRAPGVGCVFRGGQ